MATCCGLRRSQLNADYAWQLQNQEQKDNALYKLVNLQQEGDLVKVYSERGPEVLKEHIKDELVEFLYDGGKGKTITQLEYLRWKESCETKTIGADVTNMLTDEELLVKYRDSYDVTGGGFKDHVACWELSKRGSVGETVLHLCMLFSKTQTFQDIAKILLELFPRLSLDYYEGDEYYGESSLHIAIVNQDFEMVRRLVACGANVHQRASGRFFLPEDQKKKFTKKSDYNGYAYYGEYPLAFAACFGCEDIYDYLIDHGADPNLQDSFGNTVLHMMVISNQTSMFSYAVNHHTKKAILDKCNSQQLTPLTLASKLGRFQLFTEIMELQSREVWRYSNITLSMFPLAGLDTIDARGQTNWSSALMYITDGNTDEHLQLLEGDVIRRLLDDKWKTFARRRFYERLLLAVLHLLVLSVAIYTRPNEIIFVPTRPPTTQTIVRYVAEVIVCVDSIIYLILELVEIRLQGFFAFVRNQTSAPAKFIFNISCLLVLLCIPMRFLNQQTVERVLLAFAAPCAWAILLFFARGVSMFGPFVIMIYRMCATDSVRFLAIYVIFIIAFAQGFKTSGVFVTVFYQMLKGDLFRFGIIYMLFLIGFSECFYFLFKDYNGSDKTEFATIGGTVMMLFEMTLGEYKYDSFDNTVVPELTKAVFVVFAILVPILLLNMLIAMMGNTYEQIIQRSEKEWKRQWAKIITVLERTYSHKKLVEFQFKYSVEFDKSPTNDWSRGIMVIKTSAKTKARQRKGAFTNWKRVTGIVKTMIRDHQKSLSAAAAAATVNTLPHQHKHHSRRSQRQLDTELQHNKPLPGLMGVTEQLAWEKDLDLHGGGGGGSNGDSGSNGNGSGGGGHTVTTTREVDIVTESYLQQQLNNTSHMTAGVNTSTGIVHSNTGTNSSTVGPVTGLVTTSTTTTVHNRSRSAFSRPSRVEPLGTFNGHHKHKTAVAAAATTTTEEMPEDDISMTASLASLVTASGM